MSHLHRALRLAMKSLFFVSGLNAVKGTISGPLVSGPWSSTRLPCHLSSTRTELPKFLSLGNGDLLPKNCLVSQVLFVTTIIDGILKSRG